MKKHLTELVFILDKSGSMAGLETDTIGGYNAMLKKQRTGEGDVNVTTVLFSDRIRQICTRESIEQVPLMTEKEYQVGGCTALLDAIGETIVYMKNVQKYAKPDQRADKVLFIITTDGYENASREYNYEKVRKMVEDQKKEDWEFLFLGANIDAISTAAKFGIQPQFATNYVADEEGTRLNYEAMDKAVTCARMSAPMEGWKAAVEADYQRRKTQKTGRQAD
ncbi:MAG: VWA domain-containing protein [Lachnospiraceae bacterium]|nr:VWA domain-containing protein [Lachnospiraceae bacterium]